MPDMYKPRLHEQTSGYRQHAKHVPRQLNMRIEARGAGPALLRTYGLGPRYVSIVDHNKAVADTGKLISIEHRRHHPVIHVEKNRTGRTRRVEHTDAEDKTGEAWKCN